MYASLFPILSTRDLPRLLRFYEDLLDARVHYRFPTEGEPDYVSVHIGESTLGLGQATETTGDPGRITLWVYADDCDAAVAGLRAGGAEVAAEPADQPWGERMAYVEDPEGNPVMICAELGPAR